MRDETERLAALRGLAVLESGPEPHLEAVCRTAQALFGVPLSLVSVVWETSLSLLASCGPDLPAGPRDDAFCTHAIHGGSTFVLEDAGADPRFRDTLLVARAGIRFYAGVPIALVPGLPIGTLCVMDTSPRRFDPADRARLEDLAALVTEHLRLRESSLLRQREAEAHAAAMAGASAAILGQLAEGVILTDAAGRITRVNEAAAAIHGVAALDVEPDGYTETYRLLTEDGHPHRTEDLPLVRAVAGETVRDARWVIDRPDGSRVLAVGTAQPLRDDGGVQVGAVLTVRDETARDRAERDLRESAAALRDLNATLSERVEARTRDAEAARAEAVRASAAKTEFLAAMSHEIRTPMNGVIGFADLLLDEEGLPAGARRHAERIRAAGGALMTLVDDILDFSKIEAGAVELVPEPFDLHRLLDEAVALAGCEARRKGLDLRLEAAPGLPASLVGDAGRLRQVLLNLLNNAVKFTKAGGVRLVARELDASPGSARIHLSVVDTGIGIPRDRQHRLFQRFSQVDGTIQRDYGGTGLGLAICQRLVALMGGDIAVVSDDGAGSAFSFAVTMPVARGTASRAAGTAEAPARRGRLLLVEDVPLNQELARAVLEAAGHEVDVVSDGAAAVIAVDDGRYDLVLMDVQMPGMDGLSATRLIRRLHGPQARVPIVAMTANVLPEQVRSFREAGMDDHVGKPFRRAALHAVIDRWLGAGPTGGGDPANDAGPAIVDAEVHGEIRRLFGDARADGLVETLLRDLEAGFAGDGGSAADRDAHRARAHAFVGSAGLLGFAALSRACADLEGCGEAQVARDPLAFDRGLARIRAVAAATAGASEAAAQEPVAAAG